MSLHSPASSAFELHGAATDVTYSPGEHLVVRDAAGKRVYSAHGLTVEPVSLGHVITARPDPAGEPDTIFSLLLSRVPPGGGPVSAVAITAQAKGAAWSVVALHGKAGENATRAARAAAVRSVSTPDAADVPGEQSGPGGKAGAIARTAAGALSVNVALDQLLAPDAADASAPDADAGDDLPVPHDGVTFYAHLGDEAPIEDDLAEPDADDEPGSEDADDDFLGGLGGGPDLPHDLI